MPLNRFRSAKDVQSSGADWRARLAAARDEREVLLVVREFISSRTHFEWALLGMQPEAANMESAGHLAAFSYDVKRMLPPHEENAERVVATMTAFFSDAVARIAHLSNPRNAAA
jgi:hypothetical protein